LFTVSELLKKPAFQCRNVLTVSKQVHIHVVYFIVIVKLILYDFIEFGPPF